MSATRVLFVVGWNVNMLFVSLRGSQLTNKAQTEAFDELVESVDYITFPAASQQLFCLWLQYTNRIELFIEFVFLTITEPWNPSSVSCSKAVKLNSRTTFVHRLRNQQTYINQQSSMVFMMCHNNRNTFTYAQTWNMKNKYWRGKLVSSFTKLKKGKQWVSGFES